MYAVQSLSTLILSYGNTHPLIVHCIPKFNEGSNTREREGRREREGEREGRREREGRKGGIMLYTTTQKQQQSI